MKNVIGFRNKLKAPAKDKTSFLHLHQKRQLLRLLVLQLFLAGVVVTYILLKNA